MSKRTKLLGAACLAAAALAAGPASANSLMSMQGVLDTSFTRFMPKGGTDFNAWTLGGQVAGPLADIANMNFQAGASYAHEWATHASTEDWNFNGDLFWAGSMSRFGIDLTYNTANTSGYAGGGGVFGEYYFGDVTVAAKGGYISTGGQNQGGDGNYFGVGAAFYPMPDLSVSGGWIWSGLNTGGSLCGGPTNCGVTGAHTNSWGAEAEFKLPADFLGGAPSIYGGFAYNQFTGSVGPGPGTTKYDTHELVWRIGLRFYTGMGSLEDHHRNGTLRPWLTGG